MLQRLFDYIGGKNEPNVKINMTAPVVTKVEHGDGPFCKSNFTVSFFVPFADQVRKTHPFHLLTTVHSAAARCMHTQQNRILHTIGPPCWGADWSCGAQDDTPQPTSKDVYIHDSPSATFYVSQYSGFSMDDITVTKHVRSATAADSCHGEVSTASQDWQTLRLQSARRGLKAFGFCCTPNPNMNDSLLILVGLQANDLIKKLGEDGEEFEKSFYFTAGYDAPFK